MKKFFVLFLCILSVVIVISCKNEPVASEQAPTTPPAPKIGPSDEEQAAVLAGTAYYRLTATREAKRIVGLQYADEDGAFDPEAGDVFTITYRIEHTVTRIYFRDASQNVYYPDTLSYHVPLASEDPYLSAPDEDGWVTFTFTFSEMAAPHSGIRIEFASYPDDAGGSKFQDGEYIEIKEITFKGEKLTIEIVGEDDSYQSDHGVWNNTNTDHTLPTLEVKNYESE